MERPGCPNSGEGNAAADASMMPTADEQLARLWSMLAAAEVEAAAPVQWPLLGEVSRVQGNLR